MFIKYQLDARAHHKLFRYESFWKPTQSIMPRTLLRTGDIRRRNPAIKRCITKEDKQDRCAWAKKQALGEYDGSLTGLMGGRLGKLSWVVTSSGEDGKPLQRERELQIEGTTSTEVLQMQTARNFHLGAQNRYDVEWKLIKPASCFLYNTQTYVFLEPLEFFFNLTGG